MHARRLRRGRWRSGCAGRCVQAANQTMPPPLPTCPLITTHVALTDHGPDDTASCACVPQNLHKAARQGLVEVVEALLEKGAHVEEQDEVRRCTVCWVDVEYAPMHTPGAHTAHARSLHPTGRTPTQHSWWRPSGGVRR